jgi:hypothetical protein
MMFSKNITTNFQVGAKITVLAMIAVTVVHGAADETTITNENDESGDESGGAKIIRTDLSEKELADKLTAKRNATGPKTSGELWSDFRTLQVNRIITHTEAHGRAKGQLRLVSQFHSKLGKFINELAYQSDDAKTARATIIAMVDKICTLKDRITDFDQEVQKNMAATRKTAEYTGPRAKVKELVDVPNPGYFSTTEWLNYKKDCRNLDRCWNPQQSVLTPGIDADTCDEAQERYDRYIRQRQASRRLLEAEQGQ